jgi:hypothetical protein
MFTKTWKIWVILWDDRKSPKNMRLVTHAFVLRRAVVPGGRWIRVRINGKTMFYSNSTGEFLTDIFKETGKKEVPRGAKYVTVKEANELAPKF